MDAVPHGFNPFSAKHTEYDHERTQEIGEVPPRQLAAGPHRQVEGVIGAKHLHAHDSEDEDDDGQDEAQVAQSAHCSTDDADEEIQRWPRFSQLENSQLKKYANMHLRCSYTAAVFCSVFSAHNGGTILRLTDMRQDT